ncbi:MAG: aminomethyl-transferring glycine dehydrogenase subunit GcvPA [Muribaculaceae bacterium]|nr:aminomethyl-transferring glycine dehydrogenase subunit GcvPA [Muribaculaceae bacterium]
MTPHRYFPFGDGDITAMLQRIGVDSVDDLFADIPSELRLKHGYDLPEEMSETEVREYFGKLRAKNTALVCFAGAGFYDHYSPAVIDAITSRSEFLTAYTPYQPEISQGTLQYIFEYQSMMAELTGLYISNASMYDGSTATAEAMLMMVGAARKKNRVLVASTLLPAVIDVVKTYARYHGVTVDLIPEAGNGTADSEAMKMMLAAGDVAGVIASSPNAHGLLEDFEGWADAIHGAKALFTINTHASALGVLKSPAEWGADIAVGEAQSLGFPLNYGGPGLGYMCTTKALMRKMPGRVVGATVDDKGQRVFVLTLQAREQHIRREKATSNICSNQGIMTLYAAMYLSLLGASGLKEVNSRSHDGAVYAASRIEAETKSRLAYTAPFLNEFVITTHCPADKIIADAEAAGILAGVKVGHDKLMVAVTEQRTREEIDKLVDIIKNA